MGLVQDEMAGELSERVQGREARWGSDEQARAALICAELAAGRGGDAGHATAMAHCG